MPLKYGYMLADMVLRNRINEWDVEFIMLSDQGKYVQFVRPRLMC
jgi:hypothetical protein